MAEDPFRKWPSELRPFKSLLSLHEHGQILVVIDTTPLGTGFFIVLIEQGNLQLARHFLKSCLSLVEETKHDTSGEFLLLIIIHFEDLFESRDVNGTGLVTDEDFFKLHRKSFSQ